MRCAAITRAGERCRLEATVGSYCWSHSPQTEEQRKERAHRGGKAGGNGRSGAGEIRDLKRRLNEVIDAVLEGSQDRGRAAVAIQGFNALRGVMELERKIRELDELEQRIRALEEEQPRGRGYSRWH